MTIRRQFAVITLLFFSLLQAGCVTTTIQQVDGWRWGSYGINCPPLELRNGISMGTQNQQQLQRAIRYTEKELAMNLFTYKKQKGKPYVIVHGATPWHLKYSDPCAAVSGGKRYLVGGFLGRTFKRPDDGPPQYFEIVVCTALLRRAAASVDTKMPGAKAAEVIRRLGVWGHFAHELLHPYMGNAQTATHARHTNGLMAASPEYMSIGEVTRGVFRRISRACR